MAESDVMGGFALYVQDRRLRYTYSFLGIKVDTLPPARNVARRAKSRSATSSRPIAPVNSPPAAAAGSSSPTARSARTTSSERSRSGSRPTPAWTSAETTATRFASYVRNRRSPSPGRFSRSTSTWSLSMRHPDGVAVSQVPGQVLVFIV